MQEKRSLQPLEIFSRLVLPAWMSSLRYALASRQATHSQAIPALIAGSSIAVELGRNAKQALEWELRKANYTLCRQTFLSQLMARSTSLQNGERQTMRLRVRQSWCHANSRARARNPGLHGRSARLQKNCLTCSILARNP
jgi:hypothetical protein